MEKIYLLKWIDNKEEIHSLAAYKTLAKATKDLQTLEKLSPFKKTHWIETIYLIH